MEAALGEGLYWDPNGIALTLPFLDHPVRWYGILFALGIFLAYFLMARMVEVKLQLWRPFCEGDVSSWDALLQGIQSPSSSLLKGKKAQLGKRNQLALDSWRPGEAPSTELKKGVIKLLAPLHKEGEREVGIPGVLTAKEQGYAVTDRMMVYAILAILVGARLGHVFFYEWSYYRHHPDEIIKVWQGGLASHGGAIGMLVALWLFRRSIRGEYPTLSVVNLLDYTAICAGLVGAFIRLGNFFNQEILGTPSSLPWAVTFGHPADGSVPLPRHPVQLYEACFYLLVFGALWRVWKERAGRLPPGRLMGWYLILVFGFRFFVERFKAPLAILAEAQNGVHMGQLLSLPFILLGLYFLFSKKDLKEGPAFS